MAGSSGLFIKFGKLIEKEFPEFRPFDLSPEDPFSRSWISEKVDYLYYIVLIRSWSSKDFFIELGVVRNKDQILSGSYPKERLGRLQMGRDDWWSYSDPESVDAQLKEVLFSLKRVGLPWLDQQVPNLPKFDEKYVIDMNKWFDQMKFESMIGEEIEKRLPEVIKNGEWTETNKSYEKIYSLPLDKGGRLAIQIIYVRHGEGLWRLGFYLALIRSKSQKHFIGRLLGKAGLLPSKNEAPDKKIDRDTYYWYTEKEKVMETLEEGIGLIPKYIPEFLMSEGYR